MIRNIWDVLEIDLQLVFKDSELIIIIFTINKIKFNL